MQLVKLLFLLVRRLNCKKNKKTLFYRVRSFRTRFFFFFFNRVGKKKRIAEHLLNGITRFLIKTLSYLSFFLVINALHLVSKN